MNQTQLNVIRDALRKKATQVALNRTWKLLHQDHGIGTIVTNALCLTDRDYQILENMYKTYRKDDVLDEQSKGLNRLDTVNIHRNEKSTSKNVFDDQLVFASVHHDLPLSSVSLPIGYATYVATIDHSQLNIHGIKRLVVLENATMLITLHQWLHCLPINWQDSLFVYRGQGKNQTHVKNLLSQLEVNVPVAIFADFDPSGLSISVNFHSIRPVSIVVPKNWQNLKSDHSCNQINKFFDQSYLVNPLKEKNLSNSIIIDVLTLIESERIALMQENVLLLKKLEVLDLD